MKQFDPKYLPYIGAVSSAILMTYAGVDCWGVWGWVIGPGVGITASFSVATASSRIGSITAKGRRLLAYVMLTAMMFVGPATIALSLYAPKSPWTAIAWGAAVDVSIVLAGAISGKGFVAQDPANSQLKPAKAKKQRKIADENPAMLAIPAALPIVEPAKPAYFCKADGCSGNPKTPDGHFDTQAALNAHGRKHNQKPLAVGLFEQATKEQVKQ